MKVRKRLFAVIATLSWGATAESAIASAQVVASPGGNALIRIEDDASRYSVQWRGETVVAASPLGLGLDGALAFGALALERREDLEVDRNIPLVATKASMARDHYRGATLTFRETSPGLYLLDQAGADALRKFVADGGTAIMTAFSAKVDEHSQWYDTPLPGRLSDVFGMRTSEFYRTGTTVAGLGGRDIESKIAYYEVLEPYTAETMARFSNVDGTPPAITVNRFGKGRAIYVATPAQSQIMGPLYRQLYAGLGVEPGPKTSEGVYAREVDGRVLYVNTTSENREVAIGGAMHGVLSGKRWSGTLRLEPLGVDLLEKR